MILTSGARLQDGGKAARGGEGVAMDVFVKAGGALRYIALFGGVLSLLYSCLRGSPYFPQCCAQIFLISAVVGGKLRF